MTIRSKKRSTSSSLAIIASSALFVVSVIGGGAYVALNKMGEETLDVAYCYERDDQYTIALWVDFSHTKHSSDSQIRDLRNLTLREFENLPANGKLYVYTTANDISATVVEPYFQICRPANDATEQASLGAPYKLSTELKNASEKAYARFNQKLDEMIAAAKDPSKAAKSSPVISQFQGISRFNYGAPLNRLIAFSDGLENSSTNGEWCVEEGALIPFEEFAARTDYKNIKLDDLSNVDVDFYNVQYGSMPNEKLPFCEGHQPLYDFFDGLFRDAGAENVRITPLTLGAN